MKHNAIILSGIVSVKNIPIDNPSIYFINVLVILIWKNIITPITIDRQQITPILRNVCIL
jgi:hypothetical protein